MLTVLTLVVIAVIALVLGLLGLIVVGIRQEPSWTELSEVAPSLVAALVRRLLGLYVRKASPTAPSAYRQEEGTPEAPGTRPVATIQRRDSRRL